MTIDLKKLKSVSAAISVALAGFVFQSCFTGIEHTGHIDLSKRDREITRRISREESFMADIVGVTASRWETGRKFFVAGDRAELMFDTPPENPVGKILSYSDISEKITPAGTRRIVLLFSDSIGNLYRYVTGKESADAISSSELPMLIDIELVNQLNDKLKGRNLWTRTSKWLAADGEPVRGKKFEPVTISAVEGGTEALPFLIRFVDAAGEHRYLRMSHSQGNLATRPFHTLFALEDPRKDNPGISDEVWELIKNGKVRNGMTKQECRLSLGTPDNSDAGHDFSKTIDVWSYANGIYLRFEDGILVNFRN